PVHPEALTQDGLLNLFDAEETGGNVILDPATDEDMRGKNAVEKKSLEVVYDQA
ncbi:MAG TPA: chlorophyllide reductase iron protein subunit X, partial [Alphaproteobacteria bacterium]|nr:chlorophyllide reductase iron protein subunit X [Alphaproteobacteria bacterium]